jgi:hypothetical protein
MWKSVRRPLSMSLLAEALPGAMSPSLRLKRCADSSCGQFMREEEVMSGPSANPCPDSSECRQETQGGGIDQ